MKRFRVLFSLVPLLVLACAQPDNSSPQAADSPAAEDPILTTAVLSGTVTTLAGSVVSGNTNSTGVSARFNSPFGVATDGTNVYVADSGNNLLRQIVISSREVTTLAGTGTAGSNDGPGVQATFSSPMGLCTDGTNLYVADNNGNRIRKIDLASGEVSTVAGGGMGSTNGIGAGASFSSPYHLALKSGYSRLFVADSGNHMIRMIE